MKQFVSKFSAWVSKGQNKIWYYPALAFLAALDAAVWVIPADGVLISSVLLNRRRWLYALVSVAAGSTIGAVVVLCIASGLQSTLTTLSGFDQSVISGFIDAIHENAFWFYWSIAAGPLPLQPTLYLPAVADVPIPAAIAAIFFGRMSKYLIFCLGIVFVLPSLRKINFFKHRERLNSSRFAGSRF